MARPRGLPLLHLSRSCLFGAAPSFFYLDFLKAAFGVIIEALMQTSPLNLRRAHPNSLFPYAYFLACAQHGKSDL